GDGVRDGHRLRSAARLGAPHAGDRRARGARASDEGRPLDTPLSGAGRFGGRATAPRWRRPCQRGATEHVVSARTLVEKLWERHVVDQAPDGTALLYIDRHLVYEVTSPQAFEGLRMSGRKPWRRETVLATADHNVPTTSRAHGIADPLSRMQVDQLTKNCDEFGITEFGLQDRRQGIIHVIGPEQGATLPGMTVVAGDSHTSTHGAFAALAFGVGTSEVEHVMATQCLSIKKMKPMLVKVEGDLAPGVTAKDVVLAIIGRIGTAGGTGYAIEFGGQTIRSLSMEGRMTLCNMSIEAGARVGIVAVDDKTIEYL